MGTLKKILIWIVIIFIAFVALGMIFGERGSPQEDPPSNEEPATRNASVENPITTDKKVSLVLTYPDSIKNWNLESINKTYILAKDSGIKLSYLYYDWGDLETSKDNYNLGALGFNVDMSKKNNIKIALVIQVIHTSYVGKTPTDIEFTSFNDPEYKARFQEFILTVLENFDEEIEYLWIGNEIDAYLNRNKDQIEDYKEFFDETYEAIKSEYPNTKVGTITTYYDAINNKDKHDDISNVIETVGEKGDMIGFSVYPQHSNAEPTETERLFDEMSIIADRMGKKFAISETAWSSEGYGGSEEKQVEYIKNLFSAYKKHKNRMEYLGLFNIYDFTAEDNKAILSDFKITDKEFLKWTSTLGLAHNNGKAKQVWHTFLEEMRR